MAARETVEREVQLAEGAVRRAKLLDLLNGPGSAAADAAMAGAGEHYQAAIDAGLDAWLDGVQ